MNLEKTIYVIEEEGIKPENENIPSKSLIQDIISSDTNIINNEEEKKEEQEPVIEEENKIKWSIIRIEESGDLNANKPKLLILDQRIIEEKTN